jgi:hypothetical protein
VRSILLISRRFSFRFDPRYKKVAKLFGVTPERAWVEVTDDELRAHFGRWRLHTALENVTAVDQTGPYLFIKTAGPPRLGITDLGLTFATNCERGVLISFREAVPAIEPLGLLRHPELTVTVAEPGELMVVLAERINRHS